MSTKNSNNTIEGVDMSLQCATDQPPNESEFDDIGPTDVIRLMRSSGRHEAAQLAEELRVVAKDTENLSKKAQRLLEELQLLRERHPVV